MKNLILSFLIACILATNARSFTLNGCTDSCINGNLVLQTTDDNATVYISANGFGGESLEGIEFSVSQQGVARIDGDGLSMAPQKAVKTDVILGTGSGTGTITLGSTTVIQGALKISQPKFLIGMDSTPILGFKEGKFTPALAFGGVSTGISYRHMHGWYSQISGTVTVMIELHLADAGQATGPVTIEGLPYYPPVPVAATIDTEEVAYNGTLIARITPTTNFIYLATNSQPKTTAKYIQVDGRISSNSIIFITYSHPI